MAGGRAAPLRISSELAGYFPLSSSLSFASRDVNKSSLDYPQNLSSRPPLPDSSNTKSLRSPVRVVSLRRDRSRAVLAAESPAQRITRRFPKQSFCLLLLLSSSPVLEAPLLQPQSPFATGGSCSCRREGAEGCRKNRSRSKEQQQRQNSQRDVLAKSRDTFRIQRGAPDPRKELHQVGIKRGDVEGKMQRVEIGY